MKKTIIFLLLVIGWAKHASAQTNRVNYGTTTYTWTAGPPTGAPSSTGAKWAVDTATLRVYAWDNSAWTFTGHNVEPISGCSTPAYTPGKGDSWVVINNCSTPEIYSWSGTAWRKAGGTDYIAGPGISISGTTITNTGDLSNTNELQTISTGTNTLTLSNGGGTVTVDTDPTNDITTINAGTGISVTGTGNTRTVTNTAPDQTVTITGATGTYPNFTLPDASPTNELQTLSIAGSNLTLSGGGGTVAIPATSPAGSSGQIQFNNAGAFGGSSNLVWDNANNQLNLNNPVAIESFNIRGGIRLTNASGQLFRIRGSDGNFSIGNRNASFNTGDASNSTNIEGGTLFFTPPNNAFALGKPGRAFWFVLGGITDFSVNQRVVDISEGTGLSYNPTSGSLTRTYLSINPTINQTGTANGAIIGFDYNPTVTSVQGPHYAALFRAGQVGVGTATPNTSATLQVAGVTGGFLPPTVTTTQRNAISSPAAGLIVWNSTATKLQVYDGTNWIDLH